MSYTHCYRFTIILILLPTLLWAQIPDRPNQRDTRGYRQGDWTVLLNENDEETTVRDSAQYYRLLRYLDDLPVGPVKEFDLNGKLLSEGQMLSDRPIVLNGLITYYDEGEISELDFYENGELDLDATINLTLELSEKLKGKNKDAYVESLLKLSDLYIDADNLEKSQEYLDLLFKSTKDKEILYTAYAIQALIYDFQNEYASAETYYDDMLALSKELNGSQDPAYGVDLADIGKSMIKYGKLNKARSYLESSVLILKEHYQRDDITLTRTLSSLAIIYNKIGEYKKASLIYWELMETYKDLENGNSRQYATLMHNNAILLKSLGQYKDANDQLKKALKIRRAAYGQESFEYHATLSSLGLLMSELGSYDSSVIYLEAVHQFFEQQPNWGPNHAITVSALQNLGFTYFKKGDYDKALKVFEQVKAYWKEKTGKTSARYITQLNNLGETYKYMGDYRKSEKLLLKAYQMQSKYTGKYSSGYLKTLLHISELYAITGSDTKAKAFFDQSVENIKEQIERNFPSLSDTEKIAFYDLRKKDLDLYYSYLIRYSQQNPLALQDMMDIQLLFKGLLLNSYVGWVKKVKQSQDPALIQELEEFQQKSLKLGEYYTKQASEIKEMGADLKALGEEVNQLEKQLSSKIQERFGIEVFRKITHADIQAKLAPGEAAIDILRLHESNFKLGEAPKVAYYAMILTKDQEAPKLVKLPNGHRLEHYDIKYYRNCIIHQIQDKNSYQAFWAPIAAHLQGISKAYISLDGVYNLINPYTLQDPNTGKYVIDQIDLELATNLSDILKSNTVGSADHNKVIVVGNPDYSMPYYSRLQKLFPQKAKSIRVESIQDLASIFRVRQLPNAEREADMVAQMFDQSGWQTQLYKKGDAFEEVIKKPAFDANIWHIATHGYFDQDATHSNGGDNHPMLKSGILFAGASFALQKTAGVADLSTIVNDMQLDDGILTSFEVMNHDFSGVDLVVLSACETARGDIVNGEGVYGLQRAFKIAGAKGLVMSQWSVDDGTTAMMIKELYTHFLGGDDLHEAFKKAQLTVRKSNPEPFYWGAFIFVED